MLKHQHASQARRCCNNVTEASVYRIAISRHAVPSPLCPLVENRRTYRSAGFSPFCITSLIISSFAILRIELFLPSLSYVSELFLLSLSYAEWRWGTPPKAPPPPHVGTGENRQEYLYLCGKDIDTSVTMLHKVELVRLVVFYQILLVNSSIVIRELETTKYYKAHCLVLRILYPLCSLKFVDVVSSYSDIPIEAIIDYLYSSEISVDTQTLVDNDSL